MNVYKDLKKRFPDMHQALRKEIRRMIGPEQVKKG